MSEKKKTDYVTFILAVVAIIISIFSLLITYNNYELANRPFVGIERVHWFHENIPDNNEEDSFSAWATVKNYGSKPAENWTVKNERVIILSVDEKNLNLKLTQENKNMLEENRDSLRNDLRNQVHIEAANLLVDYFHKHPDANEEEVKKHISSWTENLPKYENVKYNGKLLVKYIEGNNDMPDYSKPISIIYPSHEATQRGWRQPMNREALDGVSTEGNNFLVLYLITEYKGQIKKFWPLNIWPLNKLWPSTPKTYSTCYVGYCFKPSLGENKTYSLREIRSWTRTD